MRTGFDDFVKRLILSNIVIILCVILSHGILLIHPNFVCLSRFPSIAALFLPLSKQVAITDPFLALVDALGLGGTPAGQEGWLAGRSSKQNIQPGARGIWMSALCRRLMVDTGFDPELLKRKGKVIRDLAIERGWDREKFDGFDQQLQDRLSAFYASSNEAFAQEHWGVSWQSLFPAATCCSTCVFGASDRGGAQGDASSDGSRVARVAFPLAVAASFLLSLRRRCVRAAQLSSGPRAWPLSRPAVVLTKGSLAPRG